MKTRTLLALLTSLAIAAFAGCGGGGGGGGASAVGASVNGVASKGPIKNGQVEAFQIFSSHNPSKSHLSSSAFFTGSTGADGSYSIPLPSSLGDDGILVKISGGTYLDEATQTEKNLSDEYPNGMRAAYGSMAGVVAGNQHLSKCVTPFTEMAVRDAGSALDDNSVKAAHDKIEHAFGLDNKGVDIANTLPFDPSAAPPAGADDARKAYTKALGILSQYEKDNSISGKKLSGLSDDLIAEIETHNGGLSAATSSLMSTSELNYDNSGNDHTGVAPAVLPSVSLSAPATGVIGASGVSLSASVSLSGSPLAGAEVKFSIASGAGVLSQRSVLTDGNGSASVTLTSASVNSVVVSASAGGVSSSSVSISFINQPTLAIVKVAASGTLPAGTLIGGISANVNYAGSGLTIAGADISASGAGLGSTLVPNATVGGTVTLGLINATGIQAGEFATLNFHVAPGNFPANGDFTIAAGASVIDTNGVAIPGMSVTMLSLSLQ